MIKKTNSNYDDWWIILVSFVWLLIYFCHPVKKGIQIFTNLTITSKLSYFEKRIQIRVQSSFFKINFFPMIYSSYFILYNSSKYLKSL